MLLRYFLGATLLVDAVVSHGFMTVPKSRNVHAFEEGLLSSEYDATALNNNIYVSEFRSTSVCGQVQGGGDMGMDFDVYDGFLMDDNPSISYTYRAGQIMTVNVTLTVHHMGHFEFSLCPTTSEQQGLATLSQDCFRTRKLEIVQDNIFGAPVDAQFPERAMIPPPQYQATTSAYILYSYNVRLPSPSEDWPSRPYVLKWMYVTANSCYPNGYEQYSIPDSWNFQYNNQLPECGEYDLPTLLSVPELFMNCADIKIEGFEATANGGSTSSSTATENTAVSSTENGNSTISSSANGTKGTTANGSSSTSSKRLSFFLFDSKRSLIMMWMMTMLPVGVSLVSGATW